MAYIKPQAIIHQEFTVASTPSVETLRAVIVGPNALLHRYNVLDEKANIYVGNYASGGMTKAFPQRSAGGIVDPNSTKLFIDNALLTYYSNLTVSGTELSAGEKPLFYCWENDDNTPGFANGVVSNSFNFVEYGANSRSAGLGNRDLKVGDYAYLRAQVDGSDTVCRTVELLSKVTGLIYTKSDPEIKNPTLYTDKAISQTAAGTFTVVKTTESTGHAAATITPAAGSYNGYKHGYSRVSYIVSFTLFKTYNCSGDLRMRVTSSDTLEDTVISIEQPAVATDYPVGSSGLSVNITPTAYEAIVTELSDMEAPGASRYSLYWTVTATQPYNALHVIDADDVVPQETVGGTLEDCDNVLRVLGDYTGEINDTFIIKCIEGGTITGDSDTVGKIKVSVSTSFGKSIIDSVELTNAIFTEAAAATSESPAILAGQAVGTLGVRLQAPSDEFSMFTGDVITVDLKAPAIDGVNGFMLADTLPPLMRAEATSDSYVALDLQLLSCEDIVITEADGVFTQEATQILINNNAEVQSGTILTAEGVARSLPLFEVSANTYNAFDYNKMYLEYREWLPNASNNLFFCDSVANLDLVPGQLEPENLLKYGVYKAMANSNGASVGYVAVKDPTNIEDWQDALAIIEGRDDVYTIVPLTTDIRYQNLVNTLIQSESAAESCHWKTGLFSVMVPESRRLVGANDTDNLTNTTSTDGNTVLARFLDDPTASNAQYTLLECTSGNTRFREWGVQPGDIVNVLSAGNVVSNTYVVDQVLTETTLLTTYGPSTADVAPNAIEIIHVNTKADTVEYVRDYAQSFSNRRIGLVWPDVITEGGVELPGYYLASALAGLKSGVAPVQGLTRVEVAGFDGFTRSRPYFTETQLDLLAGSGVWIVMEDSDGTPHSRHAINTSTVDINYREEMMTRNFDSICKYLYTIIDRFIGVTLVNQKTLHSLHYDLTKACEYLITQKQINSIANVTVRQHDLLSDRIEARIIASLPYATNNVELYVTAERAELQTVTSSKEVTNA